MTPDLSAVMFAVVTTALAATRITTRAELAAITNGAYELGCDIDLAGEPWTPIDNNFHKFTGSLDGCGHVISNLTVTAGSSNYAGLFWYLGMGATVTASGGRDYGRAGGLIGHIKSGCSVSRCFAIADVSAGSHHVGGFIGSASALLMISNCVARGDVRSSGDNYGGFAGTLTNAAAVVSDCWCSGAVWGTGDTIGSFVGNAGDTANNTIRNCSISAYGAGPRPFCGSDGSVTGGSLTVHQVEELSKDGNGTPWPEVKQRVQGATKIRTVEELIAVTNNLAQHPRPRHSGPVLHVLQVAPDHCGRVGDETCFLQCWRDRADGVQAHGRSPRARDVWAQKYLGTFKDRFAASIPGHAALLYRLWR